MKRSPDRQGAPFDRDTLCGPTCRLHHQ